MDKRIVVAFIIIVCTYQYWKSRPIHRSAGVLVSEQPVQKLITNDTISIKFKDVLIKRLADFKMKARVLSTERYWLGQAAAISPVDVAFGWNQMSDSAFLGKLNISQADRFYFYRYNNSDDAGIDPSVIVKNSANMHLIPSTKDIENKIKNLRTGHIVNLTGQLVRVDFKDGSEMKSSLTRDDTGPGACEVIWVTSLDMQ